MSDEVAARRAYMIGTEAVEELIAAREKFGPMASSHEGYAVLLEEVEELWEEVRDNKRDVAAYKAAMRTEAVQVAAMAIAFIAEVCDS
jgi:hypothetical protein